MRATFVMSYPASDWHVAAAATPRAKAGPASPRAALAEWIALADAVTTAGGHVLVCDPPAGAAPRPTGLPYAADWGALVRRDDRPLFLVPRAAAAHRAADTPIVTDFFAAAGVEVQPLPCAFAGRGDLVQVGPGRYLFVAGARATPDAAALVARELGETARFVAARVRPPFAFGDEVAAMLVNKAGDGVMLVHEAGLADRTIADLRSAFNKVDVISVDAEDAAAGACTALCVHGTVLHPPGLSTAVRSHLIRRGFQLVELDLPQLFGRGGGGPHALVNELVGFVVGAGAPDYPRGRDRIVALLETYPETHPGSPA